MSKIRNLPYGYAAFNGRIIPKPDEIAELTWVFESYKMGATCQEIAENLIKRAIPYMEGKPEWNKSKIKRILENKSYLGTNMLPSVMTEQVFYEIQEIMKSKTVNQRETPYEIQVLKGLMHCSGCGSKLTRYLTHDRDVWKCANKECEVSITKKMLENELTKMQNQLIREPDQTDLVNDNQVIQSIEMRRLTEILNDEMDKQTPDEIMIKELIFACAAAEYKETYDGEREKCENEIKRRLKSADIAETPDYDLISDITNKIYITKGKCLRLELKTGKLID